MFDPATLGDIIDGHTVRFVRVVKHAPERVWRAITDERELSEWMRYPVKFDARVGGHAQFFGDGPERIDGKVFIVDAPRTLAFSFYDAANPIEYAFGQGDWHVRWDLAPVDGGCRVTFTHRLLAGAPLWGVSEGWHEFIEQLEPFLSGELGSYAAHHARPSAEGEPSGIKQYRVHVTAALLAFGEEAASATRDAINAGRTSDALGALDRVGLALRQLHRIACQPGERPDFTLESAIPAEL